MRAVEVDRFMRLDRYWVVLVLVVVVLFSLMAGTIYKIEQKKSMTVPALTASTLNAFVAPVDEREKRLYIATSIDTATLYAKNGSSAKEYKDGLAKFTKFLSSIGYECKTVTMSEIDSLKSGDILFLIDAQAISIKDRAKVISFIKRGGDIFFNFLSGFSDENGKYSAEDFVKSITKLTLSKKGFASFKEGLSLTPKLLSPFSHYLKKGKLLEAAIYDKLPIYKSSKGGDLYMSTFDQVSAPIPKNSTLKFENDESAVLWHGYLGSGKWVYSSLPSYSFYDIDASRESYKKLMSSVVSFLSKRAVVEPYPYIDQKSVVFVSEDTEYKFSNFARFANLAKEYRVPVTAFIVAKLANLPEHKEMMSSIKTNPFVEFASHSTTHKKIVGESEEFIINETEGSKKILDKFAPTPIEGFRPPREELNDLMKKHLSKGGYRYILGAADSYLYPQFDEKFSKLIYMPRHGTDDYSYLVNLDWDQKQIVKNMIEEANYVTELNGVYTLSVHTHLFSYSTNIEIIRSFFKYLKSHPKFKPLSGREIIKRVVEYNALEYDFHQEGDRLVIDLKNSSDIDIKNLHLKIFKSPNVDIVKGVASGNLSVKVKKGDNSIVVDKISPHSGGTITLNLEGR